MEPIPRPEDHIPLAMHVAASWYATGRRWGISGDDIQGAALLGLVRACTKFDRGRGVKFSVYAYHWIQREIQLEIEKAKPKGFRHGSEASLQRQGRKMGPVPVTLSIHDAVSEAGPELIEMLASDKTIKPESGLEHAELRDALGRIRSERTRRAIILRFGLEDGSERTLSEVAAEVGISREWVRRTIDEVLPQLARVLAGKAQAA